MSVRDCDELRCFDWVVGVLVVPFQCRRVVEATVVSKIDYLGVFLCASLGLGTWRHGGRIVWEGNVFIVPHLFPIRRRSLIWCLRLMVFGIVLGENASTAISRNEDRVVGSR